MSIARVDVLRGTLDLLVLKSLSWGPAHGYGVARWIAQATGDALRIEEGSLYPALYRLEERGMIDSQWGLSENRRKAKFYQLTAAASIIAVAWALTYRLTTRRTTNRPRPLGPTAPLTAKQP